MSIGIASRRQSDRGHSRLPDGSLGRHLSYSRTASARHDLSIITVTQALFPTSCVMIKEPCGILYYLSVCNRDSVAMMSRDTDNINSDGSCWVG